MRKRQFARERDVHRSYQYVGPEDIRARAMTQPVGTEIRNAVDVIQWARNSGQRVERGALLAATFVVVTGERLLVADRHSEHVACSGGRCVLAAGEVFFAIDGTKVAVEEVSNQSTGYCPEPESWIVLKWVLDRMGIEHSGQFTLTCIYRRCMSCREHNIVKDEWFYCLMCGEKLPAEWNFEP